MKPIDWDALIAHWMRAADPSSSDHCRLEVLDIHKAPVPIIVEAAGQVKAFVCRIDIHNLRVNN